QCNVGYNWNDGTSAKTARIGTRSAVGVCTGGWGQDNDFIKTTMPAYALLECTSQPGATAEMLRGLLKAGALPTMLDMYQLGPWASPDEKGAGPGSFFADYAFAEGISINPKTGRRYMNELADRRTRAEAELKVLGESEKDKINYPIAFCSEKTTEHAEGFKAAYRDGCVFRHATVEDLAKNYEIPLPALKQQIAEYNEIVAGKRKDPFEKPLDVKQKLEAPFYSMRLTPKLHYCMGGIAITPKAEVISVETLKPIPGLYAAGEVTGGVHGMDRLGGCSSVDCLVFGLEAGKNAAALVGAKE
ncbi:MAG: flavocytochrome c, partial [Turicimonas muris]